MALARPSGLAGWRTRPLFKRALTIHEQVLGPIHPDTPTSLTTLGSLLYQQGEFAQALPLHERALAIAEAALGAKHPTAQRYRQNVGACRAALGAAGTPT